MTYLENALIIIGFSAVALFIYIFIAFIVGTIKKNNGLMDIFYGPGYFVVALTSFILNFMLNNTISLRQIIVIILVFVWALRLATYIYIRNHGKPEDYRYRAMREKWKTHIVWNSLTRVYLLQGVIIFLVCFPVWFINVSENPPIEEIVSFSGLTLLIGSLLWLIGFLFESIGDYTLYKFLQKPENKGKIMDKGLWHYTQHPNYFGEVTQWWALYLIAIAVPFGFISIFGPIYITFTIIKVSGIKLLNKRFEGDDAYSEYKRRTSTFFPWFPKKK